jgi:hypothetical protein
MKAADLEMLIESYRLIGVNEPDREKRQQAFKRMGELIAQRSPKQVEQMECERGLR